MMGTWGFIIKFSQLLCMFKNVYNKMTFFFSKCLTMPPGLQDLKKKKKKSKKLKLIQFESGISGMELSWVGKISCRRKDLLQEEMTTHSNIAPWKIPWTEKFGRLLSMGSQRIRHNSATQPAHTYKKQLIYDYQKLSKVFVIHHGALK